MKSLARLVALFALVLVIAPPLAFFLRAFTDESLMKTLMLGGTVLWFISAPVWLRSTKNAD